MVYATKVTIEGVDVTTYVISYTVVDTEDELSIATIELQKSVLSLLNVYSDQTILIQRGGTTSTDTTIFQGSVSEINKKGGKMISIHGVDKLWNLKRVLITRSWDINVDDEAGVISAIAEDIITTYGGLTASVTSTGSVDVLDKYVLRSTNGLDALKELASIVDYVVYYDPTTDTVYFRPDNATSSGQTLSIGTNLATIPKWNIDKTTIANNVELVGDYQEFSTVETFAPSGQTYTLTQKPESVIVDIDGTEKVAGILNQSTTFDYYVDPELKQVIFPSAPTGTLITISYSYLQRIRVTAKNTTSIAQYGNYGVRKTIDTIQTQDDAELKVKEIVSKFNSPAISATEVGFINIYGLSAGMEIDIVDPLNDETRTVVIRRYMYNHPYTVDLVEVDNKPRYSDYVYKNEVKRRIENLERRRENDTDLIRTITQLDRNFSVRRRYFTYSKSKIYDSFIVGHPINGLLGMGVILDDFDASTASWTTGGGGALANEGSIYVQNSAAMKATLSLAGGDLIDSTQSYGDLSTYTGAASGTPAQGTVGLWLQFDSVSSFSVSAGWLTLRLGSDASNYALYTARSYASVNGYENWGSLSLPTSLTAGIWYYMLFDLDAPDSVTGTPDWTAVDYTRIRLDVDGVGTIGDVYFDYFTISSSDYIGLNGLGDRRQSFGTAVMMQGTVGSNHQYSEYAYDTDFHDSVNSTATFDTGTYQISFTSGQIWYSLVLDNITTFSYATFTLGDTTGTMTFEISSDNKATWQTLTAGTRTAITSSDGTGTYIRITEAAAGTATIDLTTDTYGEITHPLIKLILEA